MKIGKRHIKPNLLFICAGVLCLIPALFSIYLSVFLCPIILIAVCVFGYVGKVSRETAEKKHVFRTCFLQSFIPAFLISSLYICISFLMIIFNISSVKYNFTLPMPLPIIIWIVISGVFTLIISLWISYVAVTEIFSKQKYKSGKLKK